jgi:aminomethyltransferase
MSNPAQSEIQALTHSAGVFPLASAFVSVTGQDRTRWLNGMLTNSIKDLAPGQGCYNFALNPQGKIQGDCTAFLRTADLLLQTTPAQLAPLTAFLDHYIIMDDVTLTDVTTGFHGLAVAGPSAAQTLAAAGITLPADFAPISLHTVPYNGADLTLIAAHSPLVPRFELFAPTAESSAALLATLTASGAIPCSPPSVEHLRILSGTPLYGADIRDRDLPQETAQLHALHFNKGCYVGQEIVERIRSRGAVHRSFTGFTLAGTAPAPGTPLSLDASPAGELTSVSGAYALGYIRRDALAKNSPLAFDGGSATPTKLPFVRSVA